jgi:poly(hydroxyalkanoate) depolymerase family esterase
MNPLFQRLMNEATRLTRSGNLQAATAAIQRALRGDAVADPARAPTPPMQPAAPAHNAAVVLDVEARVVEDDIAYVEPARPPEPPAQSPLAPEGPGEWSAGQFTHQGRTLGYKVYVPPRAAGVAPAARPLVLMLHGCTQGPDDFAAGTQMNALARELGVIVLYPEQTQHANAQKCWNWFKPQHQQRGRGEPAVLAALTQSIAARHHADPTRVYVAGLSAGGAMADILGRCYPDVFAAVGVHSGLPTGAASDVMSALGAMKAGAATAPRDDGRAMPPLIVFHGDADSTVSPRNGAAVVQAALASAPAATTTAQVSEGACAGGQRFTRTVYPAVAGRPVVEYWQLHGAGHAWSGGSREGSFTDPEGADASSEMLRFFLAHPLARG